MARNERLTCKEVIEPALRATGCSWQEQLRIGSGKVNLTGGLMDDEIQAIIVDYVLPRQHTTSGTIKLTCPLLIETAVLRDTIVHKALAGEL